MTVEFIGGPKDGQRMLMPDHWRRYRFIVSGWPLVAGEYCRDFGRETSDGAVRFLWTEDL